MIADTLNHLLNLGVYNQHGLCGIICADKNGVTDLDSEEDLLYQAGLDAQEIPEGNILLAGGYSWLNITTDMPQLNELTEEEQNGPQGKSWLYRLSFQLPNDDFTNRGKLLRAFDNREFIVIVKERTGAWRVLGNLTRGCDFAAELKTGTQQKPANQYNCSFTWASAYRAHYVAPE